MTKATDEIIDVKLVSKDGGSYCIRCPHCNTIIDIEGDDMSEIRGDQYRHFGRRASGETWGCGGWMEVTRDARFVKTLPEVPR